MRRSPRALLAWTAAALVALGTARLVATDLAALHRRARELGATQHVLVTTRALPLGSTVGTDDLAAAELAGEVPAGAVSRAVDAVGRTVAVPLVDGALLLEDHLAPRDRRGLAEVLPPGTRAVAVATDDGLRPAPGDVVDVLATFDPAEVVVAGGGEPTITVVRGATVLAPADPGDEFSDPARWSVTLLVTPDEAHRLAFASANGVLTLALAPPEDACCSPSSSASSRD